MADGVFIQNECCLRKSTCDALISRHSFVPAFNEALDAQDYARWKRDLEQFITPAGDDFVAALLFRGVIDPADLYLDTQVTSLLPTSIPLLSLPVMRQRALLSVIRSTLPANGESIKLIKDCMHAAGTAQVGGEQTDQALLILDTRWALVIN